MAGFSFPPPPPPPPAPTANVNGLEQPRGGFQQRGNRGRGRGHPRGGFGRGGGQRGPFDHGEQHNNISHHRQAPPQQSPLGWSTNPPILANSNFGSYQSAGDVAQPSLGYASSDFTGFKRKRDSAPHLPARPAQVKPENKPKIPAPPAVPSFGFSLPPRPPPAALSPSVDTKPQTKKQKKQNTLGLTPLDDASSKSDDDIDEEALFLQNGPSMAITHGGRSFELKTAADIAAWIAERKKRFPTQKRVAERKAAMEAARAKAREARKAEQEQQPTRGSALGRGRGKDQRQRGRGKERRGSRRDSTSMESSLPHSSSSSVGHATVPVTDENDPMARIAALEEQLRQAREALAQSHASSNTATGVSTDVEIKQEEPLQNIRAASEVQPDPPIKQESPAPPGTESKDEDFAPQLPPTTLGLSYTSDDDIEDDAQSLSAPSSPDPSSESESDSGSDPNSDSDAPPEQESTISKHPPTRVPPPPRTDPMADQICRQFAASGACRYGDKCRRSHRVICKHYARTGSCKYGDGCRMSHDVVPKTGRVGGGGSAGARSKGRLMSLRERLVESEVEGEARKSLEVVKLLGYHGFFKS